MSLAAMLSCAGCGLGAGPTPGGVRLDVTSEFGARTLRQSSARRVHGEQTVMHLLMLQHTVATRYGGGFVQSIDGLSGGQHDGEPVDWFYYVNGVEASKGAAETDVHPGDRIWWDMHDWSQTEDVPAVVGSFPEPFLHGTGGKRLPVRVECAQVQGLPCQTVTRRLRALGVPAAIAAIGTGVEPEVLHVVVGPWSAVRADPAAAQLAQGPRASGVYARFSTAGSTLSLLDADGASVQQLGAGAGLLAATSYAHGAPVWIVTGTDVAGVLGAASALGEAALHDRFAVALDGSGSVIALPEAAR